MNTFITHQNMVFDRDSEAKKLHCLFFAITVIILVCRYLNKFA